MNPNYTVPIIPQNLSKQETIVQIAEVLNHLSNITEDIFSQVNKRLDSNKEVLSAISQRVNTVREKISKLKGAKSAIQVFSSNKYPACDVYREYVSIFSNTAPVQLERHKVKPKNVSSTYEPPDKLQFYHVNISSNDRPDKLEGLGNIPHDVNFVNDLILYNSGKNLYKNFVMTDTLKGPRNVREYDDKEISELGAAPHSISQRSSLTTSVTQNYLYTPRIGEVPALDVPLDLPDLPGIADDLHYETEVGPGIAPSAVIPPNILENICNLPTIEQTESDEKEVDIPNADLPPPPPLVNELPKPQPPVESIKPQPEPIIIEKSVVDVSEPPDIEREIKLLRTDLPENDARSSLMEAIRRAGGSGKAKLRSVQETRKQIKTEPPGGDLMADLHSKLFMRRKGISGTKTNEQQNSVDTDSTLRKISAMIPPPEPKNDVESASNDEEDWE